MLTVNSDGTNVFAAAVELVTFIYEPFFHPPNPCSCQVKAEL